MAVSKLAADMSTPVPTRAQIKTWPKKRQKCRKNGGIYIYGLRDLYGFIGCTKKGSVTNKDRVSTKYQCMGFKTLSLAILGP